MSEEGFEEEELTDEEEQKLKEAMRSKAKTDGLQTKFILDGE